MYRSKSFDRQMADTLRQPGAGQSFLLGQMESDDDVTIEEALRETIRCMGIKEFSERSGIQIQNVLRFLKSKRPLKQETLERYLSVFGLRVKVILEKAS